MSTFSYILRSDIPKVAGYALAVDSACKMPIVYYQLDGGSRLLRRAAFSVPCNSIESFNMNCFKKRKPSRHRRVMAGVMQKKQRSKRAIFVEKKLAQCASLLQLSNNQYKMVTPGPASGLNGTQEVLSRNTALTIRVRVCVLRQGCRSVNRSWSTTQSLR
jgi:hypothetical protein